MRGLHRVAAVLLVGYSVFLAWALFWPTSSHPSGAVLRLQVLLGALGVGGPLFSYERLEVLMNAVIVAPVTFLVSLLFPRVTWRDCAAGGFVLAAAVEIVQGLALPGREATFSDVVANTAGALGGAVLFLLVRLMLRSNRSA